MNNRIYNDDDIEIIDIDIDDCDIEIIEIDDDVISTLPSCEKKISKSFLEKVRSRLGNHKCAIITTCCVTLIVTLTSVFYLNGFIDRSKILKDQSDVFYSAEVYDNIEFTLNDSSYDTIYVNDDYIEKGATLIIDGVDHSSDVVVDTSFLDTGHVGTYFVVYTYSSNSSQIRSLYRRINVVDNEAPVIRLLGSNVYTMLVNDEYVDEGVVVSDNSNENLLDSVVVENNIDVTTPGIYSVRYSVSDSSGNSTSILRTVVVKYSYSVSTNSVLTNSFTDNGVFLTGMVNAANFKNQMVVKNKSTGNESVIDLVSTGSNYYNMLLDVTGFENGVYEFYLVSDFLEPLMSNMTTYNRIVRSHIGNKLVTMSYDKNVVNMEVQDFTYLYDVVIDPGHGGADYGATNGGYYEKVINLEQSLYEKKRFEEHGLRVLLLRDTDDDYGIVMGDDKWEQIDRKGYAVGYYGAVSKIVYSNHHNSSGNSSSAGWEILVPASLSYDDLLVEHKIADTWSSIYIEPVDPFYRFYTKDYESGTASNKSNGEIYDFDDYYSVIRLSNKLFNVKNVIYEGAYINNNSDMYWYYDSGNWKKLSEVKIKNYVESIGVKYIEP